MLGEPDSRQAGSTGSGLHDPTLLAPWGQSRALSSFYVSFGGGLRLVGEDYLMHELQHLGLTRKGFRELCRRLGVPLIKGNKGACVDFFAFVSAFKSISRPGNPDFALPGARKRRTDASERTSDIPHKEVVEELVGGRAMFGMGTTEAQKQEISDAGTRLRKTRRRLRGQ